MAYGLKYYHTYTKFGKDYRINLKYKDYSGSSYFVPNNAGVTISYDSDSNNDIPNNLIQSRFINFNLFSTAELTDESLFIDDERGVLVELLIDDVVDFTGWLIPLNFARDYKSGAKIIELTAKDGLNQLKNRNFVNESLAYENDIQSYSSLMCQALRNIGYNLNVEIYDNYFEQNMDNTTEYCPNAQTFQNVNRFLDTTKPIDYYSILSNICWEKGLRLRQVAGVWRFISIFESKYNLIPGRKYNSSGTKIANIQIYTRVDGGETDTQLKSLEGGKIGALRPIKKITATFDYGKTYDFLKNGSFKQFSGSTPDFWTKFGTWSFGDSSPLVDGGLEISGKTNLYDISDSKYIESELVSTTDASELVFTGFIELYQNLNACKIAVVFDTISGGKLYLSKYGQLLEKATIIEFQTSTKFEISVKQLESPLLSITTGFKIRLYRGTDYNSTLPSPNKVRYRNFAVTKKSIGFMSQYDSEKYEVSQTNTDVNYQLDFDNIISGDNYYDWNLGTLYLDANGSDKTSLWQRDGETTYEGLIEHTLKGYLNLQSGFRSIVRGKFKGTCEITNVVHLTDLDKYYLINDYTYDTVNNTTDLVLVELKESTVSNTVVKKGILNGEEVEIYTNTNEQNFVSVDNSKAITIDGGTTYGVIYVDGGIDSLADDSIDESASNKGTLKIGRNNAKNIEFGNYDSINNYFGDNRFFNGAGTFYSKIDNSLLDKNVSVKIPTSLASFTVASVENSWQLGGNTTGAKKLIGSIDNYNVGQIVNNIEIGTWSSVGLSLPTISTLGSTPSFFTVIGASNLIQQRAIADVRSDLYGTGTTNYVTKRNASNQLVNSTIIDDGNNVTVNNALIAGKNALVLVGRYDATYPTTSATTGYFKIETNNNNVDSGGMTAFRLNAGTYYKAISFDYRGYFTVGNYANDSLFRAYNTNAGIVISYDGGTSNYYDANSHIFRTTSLSTLVTISNGTYVIDATGTVNASVAFRSPTINLTTGAIVGYVWKCTNTNGSGSWQAIGNSERWKGTWAANSGSAPSALPTEGDYYTVITAGTYLGVTYAVNDYAYYNGTSWVNRPNGYTLTTASTSVLGGIIIGNTLQIDGGGIANIAAVTQGNTGTLLAIGFDGYGRITSNRAVTASDIPTLTTSKLSDFNTATDARINLKVSGTINYLPKFTGSNTIGNSIAYEGNYGTGSTPAIILNGIVNAQQGFFVDTSSYLVAGEVGATTVKATRTLSAFNGTGSDGQFLKQVFHAPSGNYRSTWSSIGISDISGLQTALDGKLGTSSISGTTNYITKYASASTLGNSQIFDNGSFVGINTETAVSGFRLVVNGSATATSLRAGDATKNILLHNYFGTTPRITANGANMEFTATAVSGNIFTWFSAGDVVRMRLTTTGLFIGTNGTSTERLDVIGNIKYTGTLKPLGIVGTNGYFLKTTGVQDSWERIQIADVYNLQEVLNTFNNGVKVDYDVVYKGVGFNLYDDLEANVKMARIETYIDAGYIDFTAYKLNNDNSENYFGLRLKIGDSKLYHFVDDTEYQIYTTQNDVLRQIVDGFAGATDGYILKKVGSSMTYAIDSTGSGGSGNTYNFDSNYFSQSGTGTISVTLNSLLRNIVDNFSAATDGYVLKKSGSSLVYAVDNTSSGSSGVMSLTTNGTYGLATLSGTVLNIPQYIGERGGNIQRGNLSLITEVSGTSQYLSILAFNSTTGIGVSNYLDPAAKTFWVSTTTADEMKYKIGSPTGRFKQIDFQADKILLDTFYFDSQEFYNFAENATVKFRVNFVTLDGISRIKLTPIAG